MDEKRFDDIARAASAIGSRRGVLRVIAGGLFAAIAPAAAAGKTRKKKRTDKEKNKNNGGAKARRGPAGTRCNRGETLCGGACLGPCENGERRDRRTCDTNFG